ncbi:hypothetical protein [Sorangium atrum]|uniref:Serine protease n=1 Tax=Sorangium atrum TaxID=2995308 RepID=A0ABT5BZY0_9BACT|nr:hypothetical protein [Sorangium aterium]MDC0678983.1 hypothetical protein [Sorangium aterium]
MAEMDQKLLAGQLLAVREHAKRAAIAVVEEAGDKMFVGCCTLFRRNNRKFLITAEHVASAISRGDVALAISENRSELWTPGRGQLASTTDHDVAVMELKDQEFLERLQKAGYREFLDDRDVQRGPLPPDFLLYGYPAEDVKVNGDDLNARPSMITTQQYSGTPSGLKRPLSGYDLFLAWQGASKDLTGISGTPVWAVTNGPSAGAGVWTPDQAMKVCAVETSALRGEWIRATRWEIVEAVLQRL